VLAPFLALQTFVVPPSGNWSLPVPIPNESALIYSPPLMLWTVFAGAASSMSATNGVLIRFGRR
jgi:hypothetical protein